MIYKEKLFEINKKKKKNMKAPKSWQKHRKIAICNIYYNLNSRSVRNTNLLERRKENPFRLYACNSTEDTTQPLATNEDQPRINLDGNHEPSVN